MNAKQTALDVYLAGTAANHTKSGQLQQFHDDHLVMTQMPSMSTNAAYLPAREKI